MNAVKFNEYASVVVSAGYDRSLRAWDCRSHNTEPIQVEIFNSEKLKERKKNKHVMNTF